MIFSFKLNNTSRYSPDIIKLFWCTYEGSFSSDRFSFFSTVIDDKMLIDVTKIYTIAEPLLKLKKKDP